jgi:hypothetical protein
MLSDAFRRLEAILLGRDPPPEGRRVQPREVHTEGPRQNVSAERLLQTGE